MNAILSRRRTLLWLAPALALAVWCFFSLTRVPEGGLAVREGRLVPAAVSPLPAGLHFVPFGLYRVTRFRSEGTTPLGDPDPLEVVTPEGATIQASGEIDYRIVPDRIVELHARSRGGVDAWLNGKAKGALEPILADSALRPVSRGKERQVEAALMERLNVDLAPAGVEVRAIRLRRLRYGGDSGSPSTPLATVGRKVLWIGVDSFDWDIARPLLEAGRMPVMKRLVERGAWGNLQTVTPVLSPVVWTSIATGKRPEKHGIVDFIATDPKSGAVIPVTSTLRRTRAFWNLFGDAGVTTGVIAWWASFPAERVDGFMCTDRIAYQLFKGRIKESAEDNPLKTYPSDLYGRIAPMIQSPENVQLGELQRFMDLDRHGPRFSQDDWSRVNDFRTLLAATRTYATMAMKLFEERPTDVRVVYFEGPDTASHLFMPFMPPARPGVPPEKVEWFGRVVPEFYVYQDELIGELVDRFADEETLVVINSDHGFAFGDQRPETDSRISHGKAADWHTREGLVLLAGRDVRKGERILGASILDLVPTLLSLYGLPVGQDMDGKVLAAALSDDFLASHPVATIATWDTGERSNDTQVAGLDDDAGELLAKLESLGYIQQDKPTASVNQGSIYMQAGEYGKAIEAFKAALQRMDEGGIRLALARAYRLNREPENAEAELETLLARGFEKAAVLAEQSALRRDRKDWAGAERLIKESLAADPNYPEAHMHHARLYEQVGRLPDAVASYRRAIDLDPNHAEALNQLGVVLQKLGRTDEALAALDRAVKVNPDLPAPYNNLGLIYRSRGLAEKAREVLETGVTMAPRSAVLHNSLGSLYYDTGHPDRAIEEFEKAAELDPSNPEPVSNLGVIYTSLRRPPKAAESFRRLIDLEPDNHDARLSLALALLAQAKPDEATRALDELLKRDPRHPKALAMLGEIHLRRGRPGEALDLLEQASRLEARQPQLWNSLARCYLALNRRPDAARAMKRSLSLNPNQPDVARKLAEMGG